MKRTSIVLVLVFIFPIFSVEATVGHRLKINYAIVNEDDESLSLYGINFDLRGEIGVRIGDDLITERCTVNPTLIECSISGLPAMKGGTWTVNVSAGLPPRKNDEIDIFIPVGIAGECNYGDIVGCYTGDAETIGVGECISGTRSCIDGDWGNCVGEITPVVEECDDGNDNDCDNQVDCDDDDCATAEVCVCIIDNDGDGYGEGPGCLGPDCYDENALAYPGQTDGFAVHRGDGSFDYNCNGHILKTNYAEGISDCVYSFDEEKNLHMCSISGWAHEQSECGSQIEGITNCTFEGNFDCVPVYGELGQLQHCR